ncbi:hypothetical protein [Anaerorhabdus sp.]
MKLQEYVKIPEATSLEQIEGLADKLKVKKVIKQYVVMRITSWNSSSGFDELIEKLKDGYEIISAAGVAGAIYGSAGYDGYIEYVLEKCENE